VVIDNAETRVHQVRGLVDAASDTTQVEVRQALAEVDPDVCLA
jgi:hypothetical protein